MNDGTTLQSSEPTLCANGCGFFGTSATMNLCSKCYREELLAKEQQASLAKDAVQDKFVDVVPSASPAAVATSSNGDEPADLAVAKVSNRCSSCRKKFGVMGFKCRCGNTFCGIHRYPEKHDCEFDFKAVGSLAIAKANPVVKADKIERI